MGGVSPTTSATNKVTIFDFSLMTATELGTMSASRLHCESCEFEGVFYDRTACAKAWVELELLRRAGATEAQVAASPAARVIAARGAARLAR